MEFFSLFASTTITIMQWLSANLLLLCFMYPCLGRGGGGCPDDSCVSVAAARAVVMCLLLARTSCASPH